MSIFTRRRTPETPETDPYGIDENSPVYQDALRNTMEAMEQEEAKQRQSVAERMRQDRIQFDQALNMAAARARALNPNDTQTEEFIRKLQETSSKVLERNAGRIGLDGYGNPLPPADTASDSNNTDLADS